MVSPPDRPDRRTKCKEEKRLHDALLAWFTVPHLQSELLKKEREAVKDVLDLLRRRLAAGGKEG